MVVTKKIIFTETTQPARIAHFCRLQTVGGDLININPNHSVERKFELTNLMSEIADGGSCITSILISCIVAGLLATQNYIAAAILTAIGVAIYYFSKKGNTRYRRVFFDEQFIYFDDQKIPLSRIAEIKTFEFGTKQGVIKYQFENKIKKIYFFGFSSKNLKMLNEFIFSVKTSANSKHKKCP